MGLQKANTYLGLLLRHLRRKHGIDVNARLIHRLSLDRDNRKSARAFCSVIDGSSVINCAANIEALPDSAIVGLLMHELGHIIVGALHRDPEVTVDEYVEMMFPEIGYTYSDVVYNAVGRDGRTRRRVAHNLEVVSWTFIDKLTGAASGTH